MLGLSIAGFFLHRGPAVSTKPIALAWALGPLDAGALEVQYTVSGVDFVRAQDANEPVLAFAMLRRGSQHVALDDLNDFHAVERRGGRVFALGESTTEGPGPTLELLVSEDDGLTFEHRASIPKPNYQAAFEQWSVEGESISLVISVDDEVPLCDDWLWPGQRLFEPSLGPGRFVLRSKNAGRTWRLER